MWYNCSIEMRFPRVLVTPGKRVTILRMATMNDYIPLKRCSKCKNVFPATLEYFHKSSRAKDGLRTECKTCRVSSSHNYYERNSEKIGAYVSEWQRNNYEKWREYSIKSRHKNPEPSRQAARQYAKDNPEIVRAHHAVKYAVSKRYLPPVKDCKCAECGKQAQHYHHWSYLPEHRLDVIPLCTKCHKKVHSQ